MRLSSTGPNEKFESPLKILFDATMQNHAREKR
jgi:hypothetical protein